VIRQDGHDELRLKSNWSTYALETPLYYGWRVTRWGEHAGWAFDLTHHKLFLQDPPPEVRSFAISHGYNLLTVQRLWERDRWFHGLGLGAVVAHPESEVRGRPFDEHGGLWGTGYHLSGPSVAAMLGHTRRIKGRVLGSAEVRLTLSHARVPISGGDALVPNLAVHGTVGVGWSSAH